MKGLLDDSGFTLIDIIAVLVILGIIAALSVGRYIDLENNARQKAVDNVTSEINSRESLTWANYRISGRGFVSDAKVFGAINYIFDHNSTWNSGGPTTSCGILNFK